MKIKPHLLALGMLVQFDVAAADAQAVAEEVTTRIFVARDIITLDDDRPSATAVSIVGDRILATGSLAELEAQLADQPYEVERRFADQVIVPGFIAQHDHPMLAALMMTSTIIAIEDWVLPSGVVRRASGGEDYRQRLAAANAALADPDELLFSWGFHQSFHGELTRADLDAISTTRPIVVWHRSCHEFILNTAALTMMGIDEEFVASMPAPAREQSNLAEGHFWEQGLFGVSAKVLPVIAAPQRVLRGLALTEAYLHANGVTVGSEPGGMYSKQTQDAINAVFSDADTPFRYYFIPDGKSIAAMFPDRMIAETENTLTWGQGMTRMLPGQIKLFADGAIYSLAMQVREPYTGDYHGEWMMEPDQFANAFRTYWDAGYQIHVHVNGDAGVDMVLDNLEANMRRHPRFDHRTVLVHFAVSQPEQVARIKRLGAIVSANPYYVSALADRYSETGLGPERADHMVRVGDLERAGISYSFHSDMPMAPAQPLYLMQTAVSRATVSGRVAAPDQRSSRLGALKAVTLDAAYSLQLEKEIGSIEPGKLANFTVLADNPLTVAPDAISNIAIRATVQEGRILPVE